MKKNMEKEKIIKLAAHINTVNGHKGRKFNYALCRTQERCMPAKRAVDKQDKSSDKYMVYEAARLALCNEMAEKDDNKKTKSRPALTPDGQIIKLPNGETKREFVGLDDNPEFTKRMDVLLKEHAQAIKAREEQTAEVEELLKEVEEIDLFMVRFEDVPETLTREDMKPIMAMILPPEKEQS